MGKRTSKMKYEKKYENIHKQEVQEAIRAENRNKAGIYMILNNVNNNRYVGSAGTDRINVRFRNHMIHRTGAKNTAAAVAKYGIENFSFYVLEYYPGIVKKENLSTAHVGLLELETKYIKELKPEYNNILQERRDHIGALNRGKEFSAERKRMLSKIATLRNSNQELRSKLREKESKAVTLYKEDGSVHSKYSGIMKMAKAFKCCSKTINKAIAKGSVFRNIGSIKLDEKPIV